MQNVCTCSTENRYFSCRKQAALYNDALNSRAGAADMLGVSESSLRNYELGLAPTPEDVVIRMADLYNAPELENYYCINECPIGKHITPALSTEAKELDRIACSFLYHSQEEFLQDIRKAILKVSQDGVLDEQEREELAAVVRKLEDISRDVDDMRVLLQKRS